MAATDEVNWNMETLNGFTPLQLALLAGESEAAGIIAMQDNINLNVQTLVGWTVPMTAIIGGSTRCVELLAKQENCDGWNTPDKLGKTPLLEAIERKKKDIVKVLLRCPRVDPSLKDRQGNFPVMVAIKESLKEDTAMARMLILCPRVDLSTRDRDGASLQRIARWEQTEGFGFLCFIA